MPTFFRIQTITALLGLMLLVGVLALSADAGSTGAAARRSGGTYVEAMVGAPRYVNPLLASSDTDLDLTHLVFSGMTRVDEQGNIVPDIASGWQTSIDGRIYTFTLQPNLHWHDGQPLTPDDILFTLGLLKDPAFPGDPELAAPWADVQAAAPDSHTIQVTIPAPDSSFLQFTNLGILPRHLWSDVKASELERSQLNREPVGSGPWRYVRVSRSSAERESTDSPDSVSTAFLMAPTDGVLLEPNPEAPPPGPRVSRLWFRLYPTFGAALSGFEGGEVHGLGHISADRLDEVSALPGVSLHRQTLARSAMLLLNVRSPLLDRAETRQAMEFAIDRQAIVSDALQGQGRVVYSPVLSQSWAYNPLSIHRDHNLAEAERLLDSAGWVAGADGVRARNGTTLTLVLATNGDVPTNKSAAEQIKAQLQEVGLAVELAPVPRDVLLRDYLGPHAFHIVLASWEARGADPDVLDYWHTQQEQAGRLNFTGWSNPLADSALETALLTMDKESRASEYATFQDAFAEDVSGVILYSPLYSYATRAPAEGVALPSTDMLSPAYRFDTISGWYLRAKRTP